MSKQEFLPLETSGSNSWTLTAGEIIESAFGNVGIAVDGENMEPEYYERGINALNSVMRYMQAQGLKLNSQSVGALFVEKDQFKYTLEDSKCTEEYYVTTLDGDITAPIDNFIVTNIDNINVDDQIAVYQDDSSIVWSTVTAIDTGTRQVTIADTLTVDVSDGNDVVNYTDQVRPVERILQYWRREDFNDIPITEISRDEYNYLPNKETNAGQPNQAYYHRQDPKGTLYLWPPAQSDSVSIVFFDYERRIDDMCKYNDRLDLNRTYVPAVEWELSVRLGQKFQVNSEILQRVMMIRDDVFETANNFDDEVTPIKFNVNRRG